MLDIMLVWNIDKSVYQYVRYPSLFVPQIDKDLSDTHLYLLTQNPEEKNYTWYRHLHRHVLTPRIYICLDCTKREENKRKAFFYNGCNVRNLKIIKLWWGQFC
jgi:hypothetical protein